MRAAIPVADGDEAAIAADDNARLLQRLIDLLDHPDAGFVPRCSPCPWTTACRANAASIRVTATEKPPTIGACRDDDRPRRH